MLRGLVGSALVRARGSDGGASVALRSYWWRSLADESSRVLWAFVVQMDGECGA